MLVYHQPLPKISLASLVSFYFFAIPVKSMHKLPRFSTLAPSNKALFLLDKLLVITLYTKNKYLTNSKC